MFHGDDWTAHRPWGSQSAGECWSRNTGMVKWRDDDDGDEEEDDFYELRWLYFIETFNGKHFILSLFVVWTGDSYWPSDENYTRSNARGPQSRSGVSVWMVFDTAGVLKARSFAGDESPSQWVSFEWSHWTVSFTETNKTFWKFSSMALRIWPGGGRHLYKRTEVLVIR